MNPYLHPDSWIRYDRIGVLDVLTEAKAALLSLQTVPYQRRWVDTLQRIELQREIGGTTRIEGAELTDGQLEVVMQGESSNELWTRSQRQAAAALKTYEWLRTVPVECLVDQGLVLDIHRQMIRGADDDHSVPGELRGDGVNVTFGNPKQRGVEGGPMCASAFGAFVEALETEFRGHDPLIQAAAAHYQMAAMHPFEDGNGRVARALEALMLRRTNMRFVAMSGYYHEERTAYLATLAAVRQNRNGDLTPFVRFALRGVELQSKRLLRNIQLHIKRNLMRSLLHDFAEHLPLPRKRVIVTRQIKLVNVLLDAGSMRVAEFIDRVRPHYLDMKSPNKALSRDLAGLLHMGAIKAELVDPTKEESRVLRANLEWPTEITASQFYEAVEKAPSVSTNWLSARVSDDLAPV